MPSRNWRIVALVAALLFVANHFISANSHPNGSGEAFDLVILNGRVLDPESGLDGIRNVGITAGKIRAISTENLKGKSTIDAKGLVVSPGFIDLHEHGQEPRNYQFQARDGVTTSLELEVGTDDVAKWYAVREGKSLINFGASVGHIPVRMRVMKDPGSFFPTGDAAHRAAVITADSASGVGTRRVHCWSRT